MNLMGQLIKQKLGTFGWASNFSFLCISYKYYEGGMICTNDNDLYQKIYVTFSWYGKREYIITIKKVFK